MLILPMMRLSRPDEPLHAPEPDGIDDIHDSVPHHSLVYAHVVLCCLSSCSSRMVFPVKERKTSSSVGLWIAIEVIGIFRSVKERNDRTDVLVGIPEADDHFIVMGFSPGYPGFPEGFCNGCRIGRPDGHQIPAKAVLETVPGCPWR